MVSPIRSHARDGILLPYALTLRPHDPTRSILCVGRPLYDILLWYAPRPFRTDLLNGATLRAVLTYYMVLQQRTVQRICTDTTTYYMVLRRVRY
eukprot:1521533-Rhodomonas_salina.1